MSKKQQIKMRNDPSFLAQLPEDFYGPVRQKADDDGPAALQELLRF